MQKFILALIILHACAIADAHGKNAEDGLREICVKGEKPFTGRFTGRVHDYLYFERDGRIVKYKSSMIKYMNLIPEKNMYIITKNGTAQQGTVRKIVIEKEGVYYAYQPNQYRHVVTSEEFESQMSKTRLNAALWSLLPGAGQRYSNRRTAGNIITALFVSSAVATLSFYGLSKHYEALHSASKGQDQNSYDKSMMYWRFFQAGAIVTSSVFVYNVIDAAVFFEKKYDVKNDSYDRKLNVAIRHRF